MILDLVYSFVMKFLFWNVNLNVHRRHKPTTDELVNLMSTVDDLVTQVNRIERKVYRDEKKETELPLEGTPPGVGPPEPLARIFSPYLNGGT